MVWSDTRQLLGNMKQIRWIRNTFESSFSRPSIGCRVKGEKEEGLKNYFNNFYMSTEVRFTLGGCLEEK